MRITSRSALISFWLISQAEGAEPIVGVVVDANGAPVVGARVKVQASGAETTTGADGRFVVSRTPADAPAKYVTAGKVGYLNGGCALRAERRTCSITLKKLPARDFVGYAWTHPRRPSVPHDATKQPCRDCHPRQFIEWRRSTHATSGVNRAFLDAFSGGPTFVKGLDFKTSFPASNGNCATCHVPAQALKDPFGANPTRARGVERAGVFCDVCHKTADTETNADGSRPGVLSMRFVRPRPGEKHFFGPLADVFPRPNAYSPASRESRFCAPCHNGGFWNNVAYSEFAEWSTSDYARRGITCQSCHMKPHAESGRFATRKSGGLVRPASENRMHDFPGTSLLGTGAVLTVTAHVDGDRLRVTVRVHNRGAGHHIPTGSPARNVVLTVAAKDAKGKPLKLVEGPIVPTWVGDALAGMPGRGFAKIFAGAVSYEGKTRGRSAAIHPAPYWRPANIVADTRIAANATDVSTYAFARAVRSDGPIVVTAQLRHFRFYAAWLKNRKMKPAAVMERAIVVSP
ncbi:MAG: carboxypeptidase regulatory-like domain-containing protein [Deltaproteobacteria bacterium]|nr:carboxypeptidase regulatory-like domain-containing protein [Deltaproteobacteria bacterium]